MANSSISAIAPKLRSLGGDATRTPKDTGAHNLSSNVLSQNGDGILCTLCYTILLPLQRVRAQAQVLARAISCKRKRLQGRFRASASACRGGFVQAQVLAGAISCKRKRLHEITPASPYACTRPPVLPLYKTGGLGPQTPLERRTQGSPHTGVAAPFRSYSPPPRPRPQLRKPCLQRAPSGKR